MAAQQFSDLVETGLLRDVERIVVESHRALNERPGRKPWSPPDAYRWLHYEDPDPIARLQEGVQKLLRRGGTFDLQAVDKACAKASKAGFLN
jgi:hypothetical protein